MVCIGSLWLHDRRLWCCVCAGGVLCAADALSGRGTGRGLAIWDRASCRSPSAHIPHSGCSPFGGGSRGTRTAVVGRLCDRLVPSYGRAFIVGSGIGLWPGASSLGVSICLRARVPPPRTDSCRRQASNHSERKPAEVGKSLSRYRAIVSISMFTPASTTRSPSVVTSRVCGMMFTSNLSPPT
jgi:hypothetical protein